MIDELSNYECVIDCAGLHEIAITQSNSLKSLCLDALNNGTIAVPAVVWQEFQEIFEDEAANLEPNIAKKLTMRRAYHVGAASIADKLNSSFSHNRYDRQTDLYAAAIANINDCALLTSASQLTSYEKMDCAASDISHWFEKNDSNEE